MNDPTTTPPPGGPEDPPPPPPDAAADAARQAPPTTTTAPRPVFRRSASDRVVSGVAGGLARTFAIDPVVVRIITVVLCLSFPPAFIAYLAAWLLVARDDEPSRGVTGGIAFRQAGGVAFWIGVAVLVVVGLAALDDPFSGRFDLVPLVLIGIGVALWTRDGNRQPPAAAHAGTVAGPPGVESHPVGVGTDTARVETGPARVEPGPAWIDPGPPPPPRPRSPLGGITIAVALIATGVVAALDQVPSMPLDADATHLAAVALLVLGLGQLVGALWGRARWLTLVALLLLPPVLVGAAVREVQPDFAFGAVSPADGIGERSHVLSGDDQLPEELRLLAGTITIDLRDWDPSESQVDALGDSDRDLLVSVGAGEVVLVTPTSVPWRVLADVGIGDTSVTDQDGDVDRQTSQDVGRPLEVVRTGGPQDGPVLDIVVDLRVGELDLHTTTFDAQELS